MSLKHFHLIFLVFAVLCDGGIFLWTRLAREQAEALAPNLGLYAGWTTLILTIYGLWYLLVKSRTIIVE